MAKRPRPKKIDIVEAHENESGALEIWADLDGKVLHFLVPNVERAISHRKLVYGLAHTRRHVDFDNRQIVKEEVVDDVDDADERAIRHLLEEHLDRFEDPAAQWEDDMLDEDGNYDWHRQTPPDLAVEKVNRRRDKLVKARSDLKGKRLVPGTKAPKQQEPKVKLVHVNQRGRTIGEEQDGGRITRPSRPERAGPPAGTTDG